MGRHVRPRRRPVLAPAAVLGAVLVVGAAALVASVAVARDRGPAAVAQSCPTVLRVVTAASFAPVVAGVAPALAEGLSLIHI